MASRIVYNTDIFSLHRRINRFITEIIKSQSSGVSQTLPFDVKRVLRYLDSLTSYMKWIATQPILDLPETGPTEIALLEDSPMPNVENESAFDLCLLLSLLRDEMVASQSARLPTNLMAADAERATAIIMKMRNFVNDYIAVAEPLDLPESSPMFESSGLGRRTSPIDGVETPKT